MNFRPIFSYEIHQDTAYHTIATEGMVIEFQLPRTTKGLSISLSRSFLKVEISKSIFVEIAVRCRVSLNHT